MIQRVVLIVQNLVVPVLLRAHLAAQTRAALTVHRDLVVRKVVLVVQKV